MFRPSLASYKLSCRYLNHLNRFKSYDVISQPFQPVLETQGVFMNQVRPERVFSPLVDSAASLNSTSLNSTTVFSLSPPDIEFATRLFNLEFKSRFAIKYLENHKQLLTEFPAHYLDFKAQRNLYDSVMFEFKSNIDVVKENQALYSDVLLELPAHYTHFQDIIHQKGIYRSIYNDVLSDLKIHHGYHKNMPNMDLKSNDYLISIKSSPLIHQKKVPNWSLEGPRSPNGGGFGGFGGFGGSNNDFEPPFNGGNSFILIIFFGGIIIIFGNVVYTILVKYGRHLISSGTKEWLAQCAQFKRHPRFASRNLRRLLLSGVFVTGFTLLFNPERLQDVLRTFLDLLAYLAEILPAPLRQIVQFLGVLLRYIVSRLVPLIHFLRQLVLVFFGAFLLLRAITFSVQFAQYLGGGKLINFIQALQDRSLSTHSEPLLLFSIGLLKSLVFFVIPFLPELPKINQLLSRILFFSIIAGFVISDPCCVFQKMAEKVLSNPPVLKMMSCIAGRWCILLIIGNIVSQDRILKKYFYFYVCALYFFRVYALATTATSNLLV